MKIDDKNAAFNQDSTAAQAIPGKDCLIPIEEHNEEYMHKTYDWAYINPRNVNFLDKEWVVWVLLFLNAGRLKQRYLDLIKPGTSLWQVAHVYGDLVTKAALKIGEKGSFQLTDITPIQVEHAKIKLKGLDWANVVLSDAGTFETDKLYDTVCSFFLLHEVPNDVKRNIIKNMLSKMNPNGQAIFVDYHKPHFLNPIGYILTFVNKFLEPYSFSLWTHEISSFGIDTSIFNIEKEVIFGGVYQILRVTKK